MHSNGQCAQQRPMCSATVFAHHMKELEPFHSPPLFLPLFFENKILCAHTKLIQRFTFSNSSLIFHIYTPLLGFRKNKKETHELYKQEKGKRKVKNSATVFVDVPVLAAKDIYYANHDSIKLARYFPESSKIRHDHISYHNLRLSLYDALQTKINQTNLIHISFVC